MREPSRIEQEWLSWELLIWDDIKRLDYRIQRCYQAMSTFSISEADREAYVLPRIADMIREVAQ